MIEECAASGVDPSVLAARRGEDVLELGQNHFEGSGEGIRNDARIRQPYLGR